MKNEYFVPDIEDFRKGYEYEELWSNIPNEVESLLIEEWRSTIFGNSTDVSEYNRIVQLLNGTHHSFVFSGRFVRKNQIRVPYLTKEQIEAEGWKYLGPNTALTDFHYFKKDKRFLDLNCETHEIKIGEDSDYPDYQGECKSINELRFICKLLKIE